MYYIYHIPNVKIGVSKNPKRRVREQGYSDYEILEQHDCIDVVSKRENELQKEYNLEEKFVKVDYKHIIQNYQSKSPLSKKGRIWKDEWKKKLSDSHKGKKLSKEHKEKLRNWQLGKKRPECSNPGELNPNAKLTNEQVKYIRKVYWSSKNNYIKAPKGMYRANELAKMFNVKPYLIRRVALNKTYTSVK